MEKAHASWSGGSGIAGCSGTLLPPVCLTHAAPQHLCPLPQREAEGERQRAARRRDRERDAEGFEEMLGGKATGREAVLEKKAAAREAGRAREQSPEVTRVTGGGDIMGGGDSFAAAKAR